MTTESNNAKRKHPVRKIILRIVAVFFVLIIIGSVFLYYNFNRLLTNALNKNFNSSLASDVYELKFEKLSVNFLLGDIKVFNVKLLPREKPLNSYPYINSSFQLTTEKITLKNVQLVTLIKSNILSLDQIEIATPHVELNIADKVPIFLPFKDTTGAAGQGEKGSKRSIESFGLKEFELIDASFHVINSAKEREFNIKQLNISLMNLMIDQRPGKDVISYKHVDFSLGEFTGSLQKKALKHISFKDFKITIDSLDIQQTLDTTIFHFANFSTGVKKLDIQTADSIFHLTMESFNVSSKEKSIKLTNVAFKPNISDAALQRRSAYSKTLFSGSAGMVNLLGVNYDSLIYKRKIFINEIVIDKVSVALFIDKTKPTDPGIFPVYLGQQIQAIPIPLLIKHVKATNVSLVNTELNPNGKYGKANVHRGTAEIKNITSLPSNEKLTMKADAYVENKAHAYLSLGFSYNEPQFSIDGRVEKFNLPDLNPLLNSYAPAGIKKGTVDGITFSSNASRTGAAGTMTFLYHDLEVELALENKAKWKSSVLAFAANTYLDESNPGSANLPPRTVQYHFDRDPHKGFFSLIIRSVLMGLKETMIMSKENKKAYKDAKKDAKRKAKEEDKKDKKDKKK
jgi:hypothetical protein